MYYSHILKAKEIVSVYEKPEPLSLFLKNYFRLHKECGSKDRKQIAHAVYNFYRIGDALRTLEFEERLAVANYLMDNNAIENSPCKAATELSQRIENVKSFKNDFKVADIFPFSDLLSSEIDAHSFATSFLKRPLVYLRVKEEYSIPTAIDFEKQKISFEKINWGQSAFETWSIESESKVTQTESYAKGYFEIQDLSSQKTSLYFNLKPGSKVWDCCSGAGGKSLMLSNLQPEILLTATDMRPTILENLKERFARAGIKNHQTFVCDASKPLAQLELKNFDVIIADVPCSGSGTWGRNPEMLSQFDRNSLKTFFAMQCVIVENALNYLKPDGQLIYITCSVFAQENESVLNYITQNTSAKVVSSSYIKGFDKRADSMFVGVLGM